MSIIALSPPFKVMAIIMNAATVLTKTVAGKSTEAILKSTHTPWVGMVGNSVFVRRFMHNPKRTIGTTQQIQPSSLEEIYWRLGD